MIKSRRDRDDKYTTKTKIKKEGGDKRKENLKEKERKKEEESK